MQISANYPLCIYLLCICSRKYKIHTSTGNKNTFPEFIPGRGSCGWMLMNLCFGWYMRDMSITYPSQDTCLDWDWMQICIWNIYICFGFIYWCNKSCRIYVLFQSLYSYLYYTYTYTYIPKYSKPDSISLLNPQIAYVMYIWHVEWSWRSSKCLVSSSIHVFPFINELPYAFLFRDHRTPAKSKGIRSRDPFILKPITNFSPSPP